MDADPDRLLQLVEDADIVRAVDDGYELTGAFERARDDARDRIATEPVESLVSADADVDGAVLANDQQAPDFAAVLAVRELAPSIDWADAVRIASAVTRFDGSPASEGVPDIFVPLNESEIEAFLRANELSLVVFWSDSSESCELVLADVSELEAAGELDDVALGAVYTPDCTEFTRETFQVNVVPTTLFCIGERVDSRLIGAFPPRAFRAEVETIRERA